MFFAVWLAKIDKIGVFVDKMQLPILWRKWSERGSGRKNRRV